MSEFVPDAELEMVLEPGEGSGSVANNLTTTEEGFVLDARQGPAIVLLLNGKVDIDKIANNLTTTVAGYVLDARQGKALKDAVDAKLPLSGGTLKGSLLLNNGELQLVNNSFDGVASMGFTPGTFALQLSEGNNISNLFALTSDGFLTHRPFAISNGGTGATTAADARANLGITPANIGAVAMGSKTVSLPVSGWSNKKQTVTVSGVATSGKTQFVTPDPASWQHAKDCGVYVSAYAANSITFACETTPTAALTMGVAIFT